MSWLCPGWAFLISHFSFLIPHSSFLIDSVDTRKTHVNF